ncbi:MAG: GNVR domain-containing protein [Pseudomonadota bacterium]
MEQVNSLNDYIGIARRRIKSLLLPALSVMVIAAAVALLLPSIFRSSATILIEEQEIPADFVMATVTSFVEQRIQQINQRIMSTTRLLEVINQFGLYADLREKWTTEEIIEKMREDIKLDTISVDTVDRRTGRPTTATIAFTLSYEGKDPSTVLKVTTVLSSLFLEENLKVRERQSSETSQFMEDELQKVKVALASMEADIAVFKESHVHELPELVQVNLQSLNNAEQNLQRLNETLRSLREREGFLETQLASLPTDLDTQDKARLSELELQLVHLKTRYSPLHPDVIKTTAEIAELRDKMMQDRDHGDGTTNLPENPAYVTTASQLSSTRAEIESIRKQMADQDATVAKYRRRIEATPKVEQEYNLLVNERASAQAKVNELTQKLMSARVAQGLEQGKKGERFTLIDPARMPEKPVRPNRWAILLIGVVLGTGAGVGVAAVREFSDHAVRNAEALTVATGVPVLASIPRIITRQDRLRTRRRRIAWSVGSVVVLATCIAVFHFFVMDLDVFWAKLIRKIDKTVVF